jgi:hypothetical protein
MSIRPVRLSAILLLLVFGIATSETKTPLSFWRDSVKGPLTGPNADELFVNQYKDAFFPGRYTAYLEGSVVSVVRTPSNARRLLLSMERNGTADAALLFNGRGWGLKGSAWGVKTDPDKGTIVRFTGAAREFTKEPFLVTFEPDWIEFLDVETTEKQTGASR